MKVHYLDPRRDVRWRDFLEKRQDASVFHSPEWLEALYRAYGYEPVVYTTSPPGQELSDGHVFCRVSSWLTGRRLVSLPFSDHAALLKDTSYGVGPLLSHLQEEVDKKACKYIEIRPVGCEFSDQTPFAESNAFYWHKLRLSPSLDDLFRSFHRDCVQRKIRRAEREHIDYSEGRSAKHIQSFYRLLLLTHRRHHLPPQPLLWFHQMAECLGEIMRIRIVLKNSHPIAGVLTLCYKKSMVYKYACSDARYHNLGGMAFLLWRTIQDAKNRELDELDLGRSDCDNAGLIAFKERWGAERSTLKYWRYPAAALGTNRWEQNLAKRILSLTPAAALPLAGKILYRHVG